VVSAAAAAGPSATAASEDYGARLCFCLCELARHWLGQLAAKSAPSLINAIGEMLGNDAGEPFIYTHIYTYI